MSSQEQTPWRVTLQQPKGFTISHNNGMFSSNNEQIILAIKAFVAVEVSGFVFAGYKSCPSLDTDDFIFICASKEMEEAMVLFFQENPVKMNMKNVSITITSVGSVLTCTQNMCGMDCSTSVTLGVGSYKVYPKMPELNVTITKTNDPVIVGAYTLKVVSGDNTVTSGVIKVGDTFKFVFELNQMLYLRTKIKNTAGVFNTTSHPIFAIDGDRDYIVNVTNPDVSGTVELGFGGLFCHSNLDGTVMSVISGLENKRDVKFVVTESGAVLVDI
jgi:hypothetical protein